MKETQHTPEPWYVGACRPEHEGRGLSCTGIRAGQYRAGVSAPDIRRIVACVNACEGLGTEALESGALGELVKSVREMKRSHVETISEDGSAWDSADREAWDAMRAALARLGGPRR